MMRLFYNSCPALIGDWLYFPPLISEGERKHEREKKLEPKFLSFKTPWSEEIGPGGPFQRIKKKMNQLSTKRLQLEGNAKKVSRNQKKQSRRLAHKHHTNTLVVSLSLSLSGNRRGLSRRSPITNWRRPVATCSVKRCETGSRAGGSKGNSESSNSGLRPAPRLADEQSRKIGQRCQTGTCAPSVDCCFH